jgi:hypothetical protein
MISAANYFELNYISSYCFFKSKYVFNYTYFNQVRENMWERENISAGLRFSDNHTHKFIWNKFLKYIIQILSFVSLFSLILIYSILSLKSF